MSLTWFAVEIIILFAGLSVFSFYSMKKRKRQSQIYAIIVDADSETVSLQRIMSALQMDFSAVLKDVRAMSINLNYPLLKNSHIDLERQLLILSKERLEKQRRKAPKINTKCNPVDQTAIECKHCGAKNKNGSVECEYCGSPL